MSSTSSNTSAKYDILLPLWKRAIFVDWFGVLSTDLFWHTIVGNSKHPYHNEVRLASENLFRNDHAKLEAWMRGELSASDIVQSLNVQLDGRASKGYLLKRLSEDCKTAHFRAELLTGLRTRAKSAFVVIATDNMDCFVEQISRIPGLCGNVDGLLSSSRLGVLKTQNVRHFFEPWLADHKLSFRDALLLDDNPRTCRAFASCGGSAICFETEDQTLEEIDTWIASSGTTAT